MWGTQCSSSWLEEICGKCSEAFQVDVKDVVLKQHPVFYPRYPWVVGLIEWTLFKIGGRFEFFLLWLLFSRSHAVEPWTAVRKCFAVFTLAAFLRLAVFITPLLWRRCGSWHMSPLLSLSTLRDAQMTPKSCSNPECGEETDSSIIGKYSHFSASTTHIGYIEQ